MFRTLKSCFTRKRLIPSVVAVAGAALLFAPASRAHAQATETSSKAADISGWAGLSYGNPDYGEPNNHGGTLGLNYTRYFPRWWVAPSIEARGTWTTGTILTEKTISGGLRLQGEVKQRFHPYGDFLFGGGTLHYKISPDNLHFTDGGSLFSYGGGVDIDLPRHFGAVVDFQKQSWNLGPNGITKPQGGDFTLGPSMITVGVRYRLPFRAHNKQQDFDR